MSQSSSSKEVMPEDESCFNTVFYEEEELGLRSTRMTLSWKKVPIPLSLKVHPILDKLRFTEKALEECVAELPSKLSSMDCSSEDPGSNDEEAPEVATSDNSSDGDNAKGADSICEGEGDSPNTLARTENVFSKEVTESEQGIIQQKVALQQRQFAEFERREKLRKFKKVFALYDYLSLEELEDMLKDCSNDEDEMIVRLTQSDYLFKIRKAIALKYAPEVENQKSKMSQEQLEAYQQLLKKRSNTLKKTTTDSAKRHYRMTGRLALDDALKQVQENGKDANKAFEGWSAARIRAYQMINENPNSYYYRFNAPGEVQKKGQWSASEKEMFFKRLNDIGANGQWGIFAMTIPGRVGYQCSNFYRLLVETGQVNDPNYVLDEKGKAHYLFDKKTASGGVEKTFRTHNKHGTGHVSESSPVAATSDSLTGRIVKRRRRGEPKEAAVSKKKKRRMEWNSNDEDDFEDYNDNSGTYTTSTRTRSSSRRATRFTYAEESDPEEASIAEDSEDNGDAAFPDDNPLPGLIDPITLDEVVKPAISKYGHVMGYDSWVRCLTNWEGKKNICPLTKNPLTKRDLGRTELKREVYMRSNAVVLVILTYENIEEYRYMTFFENDYRNEEIILNFWLCQ
ncbi:hypothetical protein DM01DRAFT_1339275 [Hesseltinella vesiculosa]|uniref:Myb-like domain-containing protein n=1 Tax=Hesseltinella vesiculosa TaxID=101127 RepID=A0A1X2G791_9FUNG|nr:hypothetical protein DM01DRAFT_1339275 [Hesseltinella vesiculosa]